MRACALASTSRKVPTTRKKGGGGKSTKKNRNKNIIKQGTQKYQGWHPIKKSRETNPVKEK